MRTRTREGTMNKFKVECGNCLSEWVLKEDSFDNDFEGIRADLEACPLCWRKEDES